MSRIMAGMICLLLACQSQNPIDDHRVFDDSLMVRIMTDAFILHAAFSDTYGSAKDSMADVYAAQLLTKYGITQEEFDANLDRIFADPAYADTIYKQINKYAIELENEIDFESEQISPASMRLNQ